ncbi:MAG: ribosome maturation factor RimM [Saprospiraceae bacterium]|nr:16S rRNA processing protein RimM [Lewinella sp.]
MNLALIPIGRTNKTHGVDGTLRITIEDAFFEDFVAAEVVFLEEGGHPVPFFIDDRWGSGDLFLKLEEIDSKEAARPLTDKVMYLRREDMQHPGGTTEEEPHIFAKWIGYTIIDQTAGPVGVIGSVEELPEQFLAVVEYQGTEVMIPLHEQLISRVDHKKKEVVMDLPEGLLEL